MPLATTRVMMHLPRVVWTIQSIKGIWTREVNENHTAVMEHHTGPFFRLKRDTTNSQLLKYGLPKAYARTAHPERSGRTKHILQKVEETGFCNMIDICRLFVSFGNWLDCCTDKHLTPDTDKMKIDIALVSAPLSTREPELSQHR
jgi:hypothetical protein